jgi:hypothetical protein
MGLTTVSRTIEVRCQPSLTDAFQAPRRRDSLNLPAMVPACVRSLRKEKDMRNVITLAAAIAAMGCGVKSAETRVTVDEGGNVTEATLPDGTVVSGQEAYEEGIMRSVPPVDEMGTTVIEVESSSQNLSLDKGVDLGKFRIQVTPDASYLDGCIRRSFLHLKVTVTNTKIDMGPMVDLHLVAWFDSSAPCFAVMNTGFVGYGWCQKICVKDVKKGVAKTLASGLVAAGVGTALAKTISLLTAPVATAALAL